MLTMGRPLKMGGSAWAYLVDSVAGELAQGADAARYYAGAGTPPGRFLGRGLDGLGPAPGSVKVGDEVSAEMLHHMLAQLADPLTGQALGRLPAVGGKAPVAGFDMTFAPSKSVSVMWAMAEPATRAAIEEVLSQAVSEVIAWAEDHVFFTRTGAQGARQESVRGVVASTWLHYESRDGDCQVHHHRGLEPSPGRLRRALAHPRLSGPAPLGGGSVRATCRPGGGPHDATFRGGLATDHGHRRPGGQARDRRGRPRPSS